VSVAPTRAVPGVAPVEIVPAARCRLAPALVNALWTQCEPEAFGLSRDELEHILLGIGMAQNFGLAQGLAVVATEAQHAAFFAGLRIADLVLARACAAGKERAWERFLALYRAPLLRAGVAITGHETLGRELADGLYAELYGLTERNGERRSPLESFSGRGSLIGWLRTILAQRHVDYHRRTHREESLEEDGALQPPATELVAETCPLSLPMLAKAVQEALAAQGDEERFVLASYFLDGRKLHQIALVLGTHEATVSRKLKRTTQAVRKQVVKNLQRQGMSRRQAEEALETDPRDLSGVSERGLGLIGLNPPGAGDRQPENEKERLRWKELLQNSQDGAFKEQTGS
jgi:RNA polymerase sigma-70 factor (ECF subfamily)